MKYADIKMRQQKDANMQTINVKVLSQMKESTLKERLNKICTIAFQSNNDYPLFYYLQNAMTVDSVKQLCDLGIVKYNKPTGNFFVDWNSYHTCKSSLKNKPTRKKSQSKPKLKWDFTTSLLKV